MPRACVDESPPNWSVFSHVGRRLDIVTCQSGLPFFCLPSRRSREIMLGAQNMLAHGASGLVLGPVLAPRTLVRVQPLAMVERDSEGYIKEDALGDWTELKKSTARPPSTVIQPTLPDPPSPPRPPPRPLSLSLALLLHILSSPPHRIFRAYKPLTTFRRWARR